MDIPLFYKYCGFLNTIDCFFGDILILMDTITNQLMDELELKKSLSHFNLTPTEVDIFWELSRSGSSPFGLIAKRVAKHRGTVYNSLTQLIQKGFVSTSCEDNNNNNNNNQKYYQVNQNAFLSFVEKEKQELEQMEQCVDKIKSFVSLSNSLCEKILPLVEIQYGETAFKNFFLALLRESQKTGKTYQAIDTEGFMWKKLG